MFTSKCASRHHGVHVFISHLPRSLRTRSMEATFRPSGATKHWKNTVFRDFPTFSSCLIFFISDLLTSDCLHGWFVSSLIFSRLTFSMAELLPACAFPSVHIVGSFTSKLPSINHYLTIIRVFLAELELPMSSWAADSAFEAFHLSLTKMDRVFRGHRRVIKA